LERPLFHELRTNRRRRAAASGEERVDAQYAAGRQDEIDRGKQQHARVRSGPIGERAEAAARGHVVERQNNADESAKPSKQSEHQRDADANLTEPNELGEKSDVRLNRVEQEVVIRSGRFGYALLYVRGDEAVRRHESVAVQKLRHAVDQPHQAGKNANDGEPPGVRR
jgi:hypothetical protein